MLTPKAESVGNRRVTLDDHSLFVGESPTSEDDKWHDISRVSRGGYEWFYFDLESGDGNQLSVAFAAPNPFDPRYVRHFGLDPRNHVGLITQVRRPNGEQFDVYEYLHGESNLRFTEAPFHLSIGASFVETQVGADGMPVCTLRLDSVDRRQRRAVVGELVFRSVERGWKFNDGFLFSHELKGKSHFHRWIVPIPRATVTGWYVIRDCNQEHAVTVSHGLGYHDHNYGTLPMNATTSGWYWGRGYTSDGTLIFAKIFPREGNKFGYRGGEIAYFSNGGRVTVATASVAFDFGAASDSWKAPNGLSMPHTFEFAAADRRRASQVGVTVSTDRLLSSSLPYYLRSAGRFAIKNDESGGAAEQGSLIVERMDVNRLVRWYLGQVLRFWK